MAVIAGLLRFPVLFIFEVAAAALRQLVSAGQLVIGEAVVERILVKPDHPGISTLVIAMTGFAIERSRVLVLAMIALLLRNILGHVLVIVAIQAQFFLRGVTQPDVAVGAFRFQVFMAFDQLTGHEKLFNFGGLRDFASGATEEQKSETKCSHQ